MCIRMTCQVNNHERKWHDKSLAQFKNLLSKVITELKIDLLSQNIFMNFNSFLYSVTVNFALKGFIISLWLIERFWLLFWQNFGTIVR